MGTVHKPVVGKYKIYVDCYSCSEWDSSSFTTFKNSNATVRVFDRLGLKREFQIKDAAGTPNKYWQVADRECHPPAPLEGSQIGAQGFANRDNTWNFVVQSDFHKTAPN